MNINTIICDIIDAIADNDGMLKVDREHVLELMSVKKILEFYANEDNYDSPIYDEYGQYNGSLVDKDGGANARVVLWDGGEK